MQTNTSLLKKNNQGVAVIGEDTREGLTIVISIKIPDPKFSSQTKDKLVSSEIRAPLESLISDGIRNFLLENPTEAKEIIEKILEASRARDAAKKARDSSRKKDDNIGGLPGKLSDCQSKNPAESENFFSRR